MDEELKPDHSASSVQCQHAAESQAQMRMDEEFEEWQVRMMTKVAEAQASQSLRLQNDEVEQRQVRMASWFGGDQCCAVGEATSAHDALVLAEKKCWILKQHMVVNLT